MASRSPRTTAPPPADRNTHTPSYSLVFPRYVNRKLKADALPLAVRAELAELAVAAAGATADVGVLRWGWADSGQVADALARWAVEALIDVGGDRVTWRFESWQVRHTSRVGEGGGTCHGLV